VQGVRAAAGIFSELASSYADAISTFFGRVPTGDVLQRLTGREATDVTWAEHEEITIVGNLLLHNVAALEVNTPEQFRADNIPAGYAAHDLFWPPGKNPPHVFTRDVNVSLRYGDASTPTIRLLNWGSHYWLAHAVTSTATGGRTETALAPVPFPKDARSRLTTDAAALRQLIVQQLDALAAPKATPTMMNAGSEPGADKSADTNGDKGNSGSGGSTTGITISTPGSDGVGTSDCGKCGAVITAGESTCSDPGCGGTAMPAATMAPETAATTLALTQVAATSTAVAARPRTTSTTNRARAPSSAPPPGERRLTERQRVLEAKASAEAEAAATAMVAAAAAAAQKGAGQKQ
jgi:hypothetical protein